jgi:hypothetical protein
LKKDIFADTDKDIREFGEMIRFLFETKERQRLVPENPAYFFLTIEQLFQLAWLLSPPVMSQ